MKMENQKQKALEILEWNEDAKLEYLLKMDVFHIENVEDIVVQMTEHMWQWNGITMAYNGKSMLSSESDVVSELFFRTDKPITQEMVADMVEDITDVMFLGYSAKSMVVDPLNEIYEDVEEFFDVFGIQDVYGYTTAEMYEIFGEHADELMYE